MIVISVLIIVMALVCVSLVYRASRPECPFF
jgi:hypothetical protein